MSEPNSLPTIADAPLSVILWAYQAGAAVTPVLDSWLKLCEKLHRPCEVLVIDDGSSDQTAQELARYTEQPLVKILTHPSHQGEGAALRTGLAQAKYPLLATCSVDHAYTVHDLERMLQEIDKVHLVAGMRKGPPVPSLGRWLGLCWRWFLRIVLTLPNQPLPGWHGLGNYATALVQRLLFGLRLRDPGCKLRLYRRGIFPRIPVQSHSSFVHTEIAAKANFLGALMTEVTLNYQPERANPVLETSRAWRADLRQLLRKPEFGPVHLPAESAGLYEVIPSPERVSTPGADAK